MNNSTPYKRITQLFMLGLLLMLGAFGANGASAAPMQQTCTGFPMDVSTEGELNNAIACYNAETHGQKTINITADITLTATTTPFDRGANIAVLTINGNNHTIDGDGKGRVLTFLDTVAIVNDLVIKNGASTSIHPAGGVFVGLDTVVVLRNNTVSNNSAEAEAGGIYNFGTIIIDSSIVSDNSTNAGGGGMMNRGTATVRNGSTISNNMAADEGGGIFNVGTLEIDGSTVANNSTNTDGGGIINQGTVEVKNGSSISNNTSARYGGGFANFGTLTVMDSLIDGNEATSNGGGIDNEGTTTIVNSTLSGNTAVNFGGAAIGSYADDTLTIQNSTVSGNTAGTEAALLILGAATIQNSTIAGNTGNGSSAGGIQVKGSGVVTMNNSIVANNIGAADCSGTVTAGSNNLDSDGSCGGATTETPAAINLGPLQNNGGPTHTMALLAGSVAIDAATADVDIITDQRGIIRPQGAAPDLGAFEAGCSDGGFHTLASEADLNEAIRCFNGSTSGSYGTILSSDITLTRNTIPLNNPNSTTFLITAAANDPKVVDGGGVARILEVRAGKVTLLNTVFQNGLAGVTSCAGGGYKCGGAIFMDSATELEIRNGTFSNNSADYGGAIWAEDTAKLTINDSTLSNNSAVNWGGAISARDNATVTLENSSLSSNSADLGGGLLTMDSVNLSIDGGSFSGNTAGSNGGAINTTAGTVTIDNAIIQDNSASTDGGGIMFNSGTMTINGSSLSKNVAGVNGGALVNVFGTLLINSSTIDENSAGSAGGGLYVWEGATTINDSTLLSNQSTTNGGAIYLQLGTLMMSGSTVSSNVSDTDGGGVFLQDAAGNLTLNNSTFFANSAAVNGGGLVNVFGTATMNNSTFAENSAGNSGGGFYTWEGPITLNNSIVANSTNGGDCFVGNTGPVTAAANNLDSDGSCGSATTGTSAQINLGPLQNNGGPTHTMALLAGSIAIDAATADANITTDQRGTARPQGSAPDIGAFELIPGAADLSVTLTAASNSAKVDDTVTYSLEVSNAGPDAASDVSVTVSPPVGLTVETVPSGCTESGNVVTCMLGTIAANGSMKLDYTVKFTAEGSLKSDAEVSSSTADPQTGNNSASLTVTVGPKEPEPPVNTGATIFLPMIGR